MNNVLIYFCMQKVSELYDKAKESIQTQVQREQKLIKAFIKRGGGNPKLRKWGPKNLNNLLKIRERNEAPRP